MEEPGSLALSRFDKLKAPSVSRGLSNGPIPACPPKPWRTRARPQRGRLQRGAVS
jgi:hypothetical protein